MTSFPLDVKELSHLILIKVKEYKYGVNVRETALLPQEKQKNAGF